MGKLYHIFDKLQFIMSKILWENGMKSNALVPLLLKLFSTINIIKLLGANSLKGNTLRNTRNYLAI